MPSKTFDRTYAIAAYVIAILGAGLFLQLVVLTGAGIRPREQTSLGYPARLINFYLLVLFAIQHSGMARHAFKTRFARWFPPELERSTYVGASGIVVGALALFWQPLPGEPIWHGPIWISAISIAAALAIGCCCAWFDHGSFFGFTQAATGNAEVRTPLRIEGPYRHVRHPLMLGLLIALWAQPIMPPELLMLNGGLTIYILFALELEERDLVREFGEEYVRYRKKVPMLIPWKLFRRNL